MHSHVKPRAKGDCQLYEKLPFRASDFQFKQPLFKSVAVVLKKKVSIVFAVCGMGGAPVKAPTRKENDQR